MKTKVLTRHAAVRAAVAAALLTVGAPAAEGQSGVDPGRAFRGLFEVRENRTAVTFAADIYQGIDRPGVFDSDAQDIFTGIAPVLMFSRAGRSTTFGASAVAVGRYYSNAGFASLLYQGGNVGLEQKFGRIAVQLQQSIARQPTVHLGKLGSEMAMPLGSAPGVSVDEIGNGDGLVTSTSAFGIGVQAARYTWFNTGYRYEHSRFDDDRPEDGTYEPTMHRQEVTAGVSHRVGRSTGVRFMLRSVNGRTDAHATESSSEWFHNINVGVDRAQNLSLTRTMTVSFTGGAGFMRRDIGGQGLVAVGSATLTKHFGRRARATAAIERDMHFIEGLSSPALSNGFRASFEAPSGRRWTFSAKGGFTDGVVAPSAGNERLDYSARFADARVAYRVRGPFSFYGEYVWFEQTVDPFGSLPATLTDSTRRQGIRFGVILNVPLVGGQGVE
jgi:hypothetical protein